MAFYVFTINSQSLRYLYLPDCYAARRRIGIRITAQKAGQFRSATRCNSRVPARLRILPGCKKCPAYCGRFPDDRRSAGRTEVVGRPMAEMGPGGGES